MTPAGPRAQVRAVLLASWRGHRRELRGVVGWSLVQAVPAVLSGRLIAESIDDGFLAGDTVAGLAWLGLLAVTVLLGAWGTRQAYLRLAAVVEPFRDDLTRVAVAGALRRSTVPGATPDTAAVARLTEQIEIVRDSYASMLLTVLGFVITTTGTLIGLLTLAPLLLVLIAPPLVVGLALFGAALPGMAERQRATIIADEGVSETASALAGGLRDVTACGGEEEARAMVSTHIEEQARMTRELARFTAVRTIAVGLGGLLPIFLVLLAGPWLIDNGVTTGALLGAFAYMEAAHGALQALVRNLGSTGLWLLVTLARVVEASDEIEPEIEPPRRAPAPLPADSTVRLSGMSFGYGRSPEPVISGLDLLLEDGGHLAVVGPSGVGKSTLAALIAGILEPQEGEIALGGAPIHALDTPALARHRVLIPQEAYVFTGPLWENLSYLNDDLQRTELEHAVGELGMGPVAERIGGFDAEVDPRDLSAGERQLIALVRAYVSPASLVILDEASCHLDPAHERRIEVAFAERPGTLIVIAHRISSALRARRILVMDAGEARFGTHAELLADLPLYQDLVGYWEAEAPPATSPASAATSRESS
jgi:ABC-type multidrug transport system fused ATPase/permease subunit